MAVDGLILHQVLKSLKPLLPMKIQRISSPSENELLFVVRSHREKHNLLISCHSNHNRIQLTENDLMAAQEPSAFVMLLRKHCDDAIITDITQIHLDRILKIQLTKRDDLGDLHNYDLYLELMGKYANLILVDQNNRILDALKRIPAYENTQRMIQSGALYQLPHSKEKLNPFELKDIDREDSLIDTIDGFSPLFVRELQYRMEKGETFLSIMNQVEASTQLYIHPYKDELIAHLIELTHLANKGQALPIHQAYDTLYQALEEKERIKQHTSDLQKTIQRELKRNQQKLPKLQQAYEDALNYETFKVQADYILAYGMHLGTGHTQVNAYDFESSQPIRIELDPKFDGKTNAKKLYQKYHKQRKGQAYIQEQIQLTQNEIDYFENLKYQLSIAQVKDAIEIQDELISLGYMRQKGRKHKDIKHSYLHLLSPQNIHIYLGKNNTQNDLITFKLAQKNDLWFHTKDYHGAHVILAMHPADEEHIRLAAKLAAYHSEARQSSSVEVQYTPVSNVKKIPGAKPGMVTLSTYKTIFVDPIESEILEILKRFKV